MVVTVLLVVNRVVFHSVVRTVFEDAFLQGSLHEYKLIYAVFAHGVKYRFVPLLGDRPGPD
jgi:hypothetical protein